MHTDGCRATRALQLTPQWQQQPADRRLSAARRSSQSDATSPLNESLRLPLRLHGDALTLHVLAVSVCIRRQMDPASAIRAVRKHGQRRWQTTTAARRQRILHSLTHTRMRAALALSAPFPVHADSSRSSSSRHHSSSSRHASSSSGAAAAAASSSHRSAHSAARPIKVDMAKASKQYIPSADAAR